VGAAGGREHGVGGSASQPRRSGGPCQVACRLRLPSCRRQRGGVRARMPRAVGVPLGCGVRRGGRRGTRSEIGRLGSHPSRSTACSRRAARSRAAPSPRQRSRRPRARTAATSGRSASRPPRTHKNRHGPNSAPPANTSATSDR
jgi:hypothetical protein